ncbi:MAG TPA: ATP-binding protein, partial [Microthrixaceae bacterium]|nr:ATP-binding protein [Microthrixaceae bacterium]
MTGRLHPAMLVELAGLLAGGLLVEDHYTDFKRELAPNANKGLAKDIAAFAIDGGVLYIGVDEGQPGSPPSVTPVPLAGLKERVDQIARSAVTPPVAVRCTELADPDHPELGCLRVEIPPSPQAPHQAAERFWGRGDTTNHVLSPSEMDSIYERRARQTSGLETLLDIEIARDPCPEDLRQFAHIFAVAQPVSGDEELLFRSLAGQSLTSWIVDVLMARARPSRVKPDLPSASCFSLRSGGAAAHSFYITPDRGVQDDGPTAASERKLFDLEVREDGGIRVFNGRGTEDRDGLVVVLDAALASSVTRAVEAASLVAEQASYGGQWFVGVAVTNPPGARAWDATQTIRGDPTGVSGAGDR